jgi:hypothetical protein
MAVLGRTSTLSDAKAVSELGYHPVVSIEDALSEMADGG